MLTSNNDFSLLQHKPNEKSQIIIRLWNNYYRCKEYRRWYFINFVSLRYELYFQKKKKEKTTVTWIFYSLKKISEWIKICQTFVHRFIKLSKRAGRHPSPWFFLSNETKKKKKQKQKKRKELAKNWIGRITHRRKIKTPSSPEKKLTLEITPQLGEPVFHILLRLSELLLGDGQGFRSREFQIQIERRHHPSPIFDRRLNALTTKRSS